MILLMFLRCGEDQCDATICVEGGIFYTNLVVNRIYFTCTVKRFSERGPKAH